MTSAAPGFDILLPYYGDVGQMQDAVRSVLAQDGDDWRLTVVDDGREPGVPEWFEELADPGSATSAIRRTWASPATSTAASNSPSTSAW
ncbi:glycosyltransferase [Streptacidiphilus monticola]